MSRVLKDSWIQWIWMIPEDWTFGRVKNKFVFHKNIAWTDSEKYDRISLTLNGVIKRDKEDANWLQPESFEWYQIVYKDDMIFKLIDLQNVSTSRVGKSGYTWITSPAYIILSDLDNTRFSLYYFLNLWYQEVFNNIWWDGVRSAINKDDLLNVPYPILSILEQKKIADYLDKKCSKIDEQKANYEKSIELLKEYKQSLITEAVTKWLDKNVEMKDSGIDWIWETPKNWRILQIKRILKEKLQGYYDADWYVDNWYSLLRITDLLWDWKFSIENSPYCKYTKTIEQYLLSKWDFCFARTWWAGSFCYIDKDLEKCVFASYLIRFRFNGQYNPFLKYYFLSYSFLEAINSSIHWWVNQNISAEDIKDAYISLPQPEEQKQIADYLDKECSKIDKVIAYREQMIEKLDEYKKSLIYECVTGKKEIK